MRMGWPIEKLEQEMKLTRFRGHLILTEEGVRESGSTSFSDKERAILRNGSRGGVWRTPPSFDGVERNPLPRFSVVSEREKAQLQEQTKDWALTLLPCLVPGAHVMIAGNPMLQCRVQSGMAEAGYEVRGAIMRQYVGWRGGDRPKFGEREFSGVCVTPRAHYEPWMLFRKPLGERTVAQNWKRWGTGGLRRLADEKALPDVVRSGRTPNVESALSRHPTMKPQHLLRILVRAILPLGEGVVLDAFAGSGSTLAAAEAIGYEARGIELDERYFEEARETIPLLARLYPNFKGDALELEL